MTSVRGMAPVKAHPTALTSGDLLYRVTPAQQTSQGFSCSLCVKSQAAPVGGGPAWATSQLLVALPPAFTFFRRSQQCNEGGNLADKECREKAPRCDFMEDGTSTPKFDCSGLCFLADVCAMMAHGESRSADSDGPTQSFVDAFVSQAVRAETRQASFHTEWNTVEAVPNYRGMIPGVQMLLASTTR
ncbi:hypothetical protein BDV96DRAFT_600716 [Lophiotrema nucula]|uniref:Uncharacterized protein n=1 Tax=Lophiotrema nucula TaxID=690887 RepID=A0A6A5Z6D7_9PLEO|nr:hypothetical protein BDV96DRAFT_600716 [Lophiotrema nucula]